MITSRKKGRAMSKNITLHDEIPEDKRLEVIDENGETQIFEIILTFHSDTMNKSYVIYKEPGDSEEAFAASFKEEDKDGGNLEAVTSDEEWDMIEEVLNTFLDDEANAA
jgi:uncharacterized protein YrzB (UPF0473 family)